MVLMHAGGFELTAGGTCSFAVGQKDCLSEAGAMANDVIDTGWRDCQRRPWCDNVYRNAIPATIRSIFKQFNAKYGDYNGWGETDGYFALPAGYEIAGSGAPAANPMESGILFQFDWYKIAGNTIKKVGWSAASYWTRTYAYRETHRMVSVASNGMVQGTPRSTTKSGISPFGCI